MNLEMHNLQPYIIITYEFSSRQNESSCQNHEPLWNIETTYVIKLLRVHNICTYIYITKNSQDQKLCKQYDTNHSFNFSHLQSAKTYIH